MQQHLEQCPGCRDLFTELSELNSKLGSILAPIVLAGASAMLHSGRHALVRTGLSAQSRALRWHPVTAAAGAAASVAVAGGMIFAVNVTPVPTSPSHVTVRAADPASAGHGSSAGSHAPGRRGGGGGGGGGGSLAGFGSPVGSGPLAGAEASGGSGALASGIPPHVAGAPPGAGTGSPASDGTVAGSSGSAPSSPVGTVTSGTDPAGTAVTGLTGTTGIAAAGLANTASKP
jgi:hypothetical protein